MCILPQLQKQNQTSKMPPGNTNQTKQKATQNNKELDPNQKNIEHFSTLKNDLGSLTSERGPKTSKPPQVSRGPAAEKQSAFRH